MTSIHFLVSPTTIFNSKLLLQNVVVGKVCLFSNAQLVGTLVNKNGWKIGTSSYFPFWLDLDLHYYSSLQPWQQYEQNAKACVASRINLWKLIFYSKSHSFQYIMICCLLACIMRLHNPSHYIQCNSLHSSEKLHMMMHKLRLFVIPKY